VQGQVAASPEASHEGGRTVGQGQPHTVQQRLARNVWTARPNITSQQDVVIRKVKLHNKH
jgi:hypothetical protein